MKFTTKVFTLLSAAALATVSTSCANQEKAEQAKRCEAGEVLVSQELEKIDVLAMKAKALYQKAMEADENTQIGLAIKLVDKMQNVELEMGEATQVLLGRWENYVEACQDEEREDKFREEKVKPVVTRLENIAKG